jgi:hypothetical protein
MKSYDPNPDKPERQNLKAYLAKRAKVAKRVQNLGIYFKTPRLLFLAYFVYGRAYASACYELCEKKSCHFE